jgi:hypothetical protein
VDACARAVGVDLPEVENEFDVVADLEMVGILTVRRFTAAAVGLTVRRPERFSAHREASSELARVVRTVAMVGLLRKRGALPDARGARRYIPWKDGG